MSVQKTDKVIDPNNKPRWGFGVGDDGQVRVGVQTVGETGGVNTIRTERQEPDGARNNGSGVDAEFLAKLRDDHDELLGSNQALTQQNEELKRQLAALQGGGTDNQPLTHAELDAKTVAQLKEMLDARSISYKSSDNKDDLIALLIPTE